MEFFELEATASTPVVDFKPTTGEMLIKGRAIPENSEEFWSPILTWFYAYATQPAQHTRFVFNMEYFNITSSKQILFILHKLQEMKDKGLSVSAEWHYQEGDLDMKEVGNDYSTVVNIPFKIIPATDERLAYAV